MQGIAIYLNARKRVGVKENNEGVVDGIATALSAAAAPRDAGNK
jgi:hypothetical protein